jgi:hypothetical protein
MKKAGELMLGFYLGMFCGGLVTGILCLALMIILRMFKADRYQQLSQEHNMLVNRYEALARRDSKLTEKLDETREMAHLAITEKQAVLDGRVVSSQNYERFSWPEQ